MPSSPTSKKVNLKLSPSRWDLIAICYYLQRNLFEPAKRGVKPGGILISIVHVSESGQEQRRIVCAPENWKCFFKGWEILHRHEGVANDAPHRRAVAEVVARRPLAS